MIVCHIARIILQTMRSVNTELPQINLSLEIDHDMTVSEGFQAAQLQKAPICYLFNCGVHIIYI